MCRDEQEKVDVFVQASQRTVDLLETHVRNETCRGMVKRALNIYCECIASHVTEGDSGVDVSLPSSSADADADAGSPKPPASENKWANCLYRIVISIVRILRVDFENQDNPVEVELVIYFYELLKVTWLFKKRLQS